VLTKESQILNHRLKFLKQQTETLAKQKVFLFQTLKKGKEEITEAITNLEKSMTSYNDNEDYWVSVEKCIKHAKIMADLGSNSL
jgi:hypothetical protein